MQRRAVNLRGGGLRRVGHASRHVADCDAVCRCLPPHAQHLASLERLIGQLTGRPLLGGNRVTPLVGGDEAYPQMLAAIEDAERIGRVGHVHLRQRPRRADSLPKRWPPPCERGVEVRVIIDAVGARYTLPSIVGTLEKSGVPTARFLPTLVPGRFAYANLRSHRKILVVDGRLGFTGGLNIREGHDARLHPAHPILDHHFRIEGPVVDPLAGSVCRGLGLLHRRVAGRRRLVSPARAGRQRRWRAASRPGPTAIWTSCG